MECRRGLAMRIMSVRQFVRSFVRPSVCLCVTLVNCDKTEERSVQIFLHHTKEHFA